MARHGGGAFSGKDPSKVDRSAAYAMRWVAKNVVAAGLAGRCEVQVAYAIGKAMPVGLFIECFGTEKVPVERIQDAVMQVFDLRPRAIIYALDLLRPIYAQTAAYGHFGRTEPDLLVGAHRPGLRSSETPSASTFPSARPPARQRPLFASAATSPGAGVTSTAVLVGRNRDEGAEGPGGERAAARRAGRRGHLAGSSRPSLRLPRPGPPGPGGRAGLPGPGPVRLPSSSTATCWERTETSEHPGKLARLGNGRHRPSRCSRRRSSTWPGRGGRPVRGHARRRAPAGHPAAARHRRTGSPAGRDGWRPGACGSGPRLLEPLSRRGGVPGLAEGRPVRAAWSALPGPKARRDRRDRRHHGRRGRAAWSSWCRTPATWTAWTPP